MNNNPNDNLNQTQVGTTNNVAVQNSATNQEKEVLTGNAAPVVSSSTTTNEAVVISNTVTEQRVNLVNDKPAIQSIVPNNPVSSKPVEEKVEELEPVSTGDVTKENVKEPKQAGKTFFLIMVFGLLFGVVFFLPEISTYIETKKYMQTHVEEKITDGVLKCKYEDSTDTLDYNYSLKFAFSNNKLDELEYLLEVRGDANLDEKELEERKNECDQIISNVEALKGISVTCSLSNGLYKQKQLLDYSTINQEAAMSAYTEAGGIYPDYEKGDNIDDIEKNMNASGYTCERIKSLT